jgi:four helix bundle protein
MSPIPTSFFNRQSPQSLQSRQSLLGIRVFSGHHCSIWMTARGSAFHSLALMESTEGPLIRQIAMRKRTKDFALDTARMCASIPHSLPGRHVAGQLIRCSTSVAANYRAACRAKSRRDFISKIGVVLEEADESLFWLDFAKGLDLLAGEKFETLLSEADQLVAIFTATRSTARNRQRLARTPR